MLPLINVRQKYVYICNLVWNLNSEHNFGIIKFEHKENGRQKDTIRTASAIKKSCCNRVQQVLLESENR